MYQRKTGRVSISFDYLAFGLSVFHGAILTAILISVYHRRESMLFSKAILVLVGLFTLFLFVDGIVSGPYAASIGVAVGSVIATLVIRAYGSRHHTRSHASR